MANIADFFSRQQIPQQPNPEPPGFNLLRDMLMRRAFSLNSNPYGLSPGGQTNANMMGPRPQFNPYGGGGGMRTMPRSPQGGWGGGGMQQRRRMPMMPIGGGMGTGGPQGGGLQSLLAALQQAMAQKRGGGMPQQGAPQTVPFRGGSEQVTTMPLQPGGTERFLPPTPPSPPSTQYDGMRYDGAPAGPLDFLTQYSTGPGGQLGPSPLQQPYMSPSIGGPIGSDTGPGSRSFFQPGPQMANHPYLPGFNFGASHPPIAPGAMGGGGQGSTFPSSLGSAAPPPSGAAGMLQTLGARSSQPGVVSARDVPTASGTPTGPGGTPWYLLDPAGNPFPDVAPPPSSPTPPAPPTPGLPPPRGGRGGRGGKPGA